MSTYQRNKYGQTPLFSDANYGGGGALAIRCYHEHPALTIKTEQGEFTIYGGSCFTPVVKDADIYIGFDASMSIKKTYPWRAEAQGPLQLCYPITDGSVPKEVEDFKAMIGWIALQLIAHKKVHLGCIGGHGRTGLVLAALVTHMTGELDSIAYVRKNYCERAVESMEQVKWLGKHFGITPQQDSRSVRAADYAPVNGITTPNSPIEDDPDWWTGPQTKTKPRTEGKWTAQSKPPRSMFSSQPTKSPLALWGSDPATALVVFDK